MSKSATQLLVGVVVGILLLSNFGAIASALEVPKSKTVFLQFTFGKPKIEKVKYFETLYDSVSIDGLPKYGDTGEPVLPVRPVNILLPYKTTVKEIIVKASEPRYLGNGYFIEPRPRPIKIGIEEPKPPKPDPKIYDSSELYPGKLYDVVTIQYFRGFPILTINLYPVQYIPKTGEIYYYDRITVKVETKPASLNPLYRGLETDMELVKTMVDNPQEVLTYPGPYPHHSYEYVIITSEALKDTPGPYNWTALINDKISRGISATIVTVEWIENNSLFWDSNPIFNDTQAKIRNFIRWAYLNWHTEYILLGGDADLPGSEEYSNHVPARYLWVSPDDGNPNDPDATNLPSDLYYACLDGTFNSDEDDRWGEPTDGPNGEDVDLRAEVFVGRAPVDNATEVSNFVRKTLAYEHSMSQALNNVTMFAEYLGFGGPAEWASGMTEMLINGSNAHGMVTAGVPAEPPADGRYNVYRLYEENLPGGDDSPSGRINVELINNGTHMIFHDGHGSEDWVMNMSADHWDYYGAPDYYHNMTNDDYFFAYSCACDPGAFDNAGPVHGWTDDCIGEDLVVEQYGAFAVVMNARYGWGYGYSTDGPSTTFMREFVDAIFGEGIRNLGRINQDSKEDNLWRLNQDCMRWTYYETNLLGDPEIEIKPPEVKGDDAGVREIHSPKDMTGTGLNEINVSIRNYGANDLSNLPVNCSVYRLTKHILFYDDMESGSSKWTVVDGNGDGDTWTIVEPSDPTRYSSPTHAFKCTSGSTYQPNANDSLISQPIDCSGYDSVTAEFYVWFYGQYDGWSGYLDYGSVYLSDDNGATWKLVVTNLTYVNYAGNLAGVRYSFPVEAYVNLTSQVRIKFTWTADDSTENEGMYVDDVVFYAFTVDDLVYSEETTISSMPSGYTQHLAFNWNADYAGWYAINISTKLPTDEYSANNYQNITVYVMASNDVGVESINYPTGLLATGSYMINATVMNYGYADQTNVTVNCTIRDSTNAIVYYEEKQIDIASGERKYIEFGPWNVGVEDTYTINVTTLLPGDEGPYNDYKESTVTIENIYDAATVAINYPPDGVTLLGGTYTINATVMNNGTVVQPFDVKCSIYQLTAPIEIINESFEDAFPPSGWATYAVGSGWYQSSSYSHTGTYCAYHTYEYTSCDDWLVTPQFTVPDGAVLTFWERTYWDSYYVYHGIWISTGSGDPADGDFVELMEDNAATGGTWVQTTVDLSAYAGQQVYIAFRYQGYNADTWAIDDVMISSPAGTTLVFEDLKTVTIDAWQQEYVEFSPWTVTTEGDYIINVTTMLTGDEDPTNDYKEITVTINNIDDVGATAINYPTGMQPTGTYYINATIENFGNINKTNVPVNCSIYQLVPPTTIFTEDFEGYQPAQFPPSGWTEEIVSGTNPDWSLVSSGSSPTCSPYHGSNMIKFNSYSCSSGSSARLATGAMDLSGVASPQLTFYMYHDTGYSYADDCVVIQYSLDGTTWTNVTTIYRYDGSTGWKEHVVDLSAVAGQPTVYIGFLGVSDYGNNMYLDYITLPNGTLYSFEPSGWPPAGWGHEVVSGTDPDNKWQPEDGTSTHPSGITPFGNYMAEYDAYSISSGNSARLYTPPLDFTTGAGHILKFYMYHDDGYSSCEDKLVIQVSLDGTTWTDVAEFLRYDATNPGWVQHVVDLSAYDGQPTVYIGFLGVSDYGNGIYIDNIEVGYGGMVLLWSQEKTISNIPAYSSIYEEFGPWTVTTEGNYTIVVKTLMPGDEDDSNNATQTTVWINDIYDVGATAINYPVDGDVYPTGSYSVNATVENFGNVNLNDVAVKCSIYRITSSVTVIDESFEDAFPPSGWATYAVGSGWYQSSSYSHTGTYCAYHTYEYTSCDDWLVTPQFTVPDGAVLTFWERTYWDSYYVYHGIWISTGSGDPADGDFVELMEDNAATGGTWVQTTVDLSAYAGQQVYIAFRYQGYNADTWAIDDVMISSPAGTTLVFEDLKTVTIDAWQQEYVEFSPWTVTTEGDYIINVTTMLTGDEDNTNNATEAKITINDIYDVGATAINYPPDLVSTGSYIINATIHNFGNVDVTSTFDVKCTVYQLTGGGTFLQEGFESGTIPADWTVLNEDGDSYTWEAYATSEAHSGNYVARVHWNPSGCDDWLITPKISIPTGMPVTFSFWAKSYSSYYLEDFEVRLSTTGTDPSDFTVLLDSVTDTPYSWTQYTYDLTPYAGMDVYLAIRCVSVDEYYLYIDDVEVSAPPTYVKIFEETKQINGINLGEDKYIEFGPCDFANEGDYVINVTTLLAIDEDNSNNATERMITVQNIPDVGVKSIDYPVNVVTILAEDFEGAFPPAGWTVIENGDAGGRWKRNDEWGRANYAGTGYCADADSDKFGSGTYMDTELWTPPFSLANYTSATLAFNTYYNDIGAGGDYAAVDISLDGGVTWTNLLFWDEDHTGEHVEIDLTPYVGNDNVIIRWHYGDATWDYYWEVDDVHIYGKQIFPAGEYPVIATIKNYGTTTETFNVSCTIYKLSGAAPIYEEDFEEPWVPDSDGDLAPPGWEVYITDYNVNYYETYWHQSDAGGDDDIGVHSGNYAAGLWWDYNDQYEWLISPPFDFSGYSQITLTFYTYGYLGSTYGDHYYVAVSTDGITYYIVYDLSTDFPPDTGWDKWSMLHTVDLSAYAGYDNVRIAFIAYGVGGLWYVWYIDDVAIYPGAAYTSELVYYEEKTINNLTAGEERTISFGPYEFEAGFTYIINVTTMLPYDVNTSNDYKEATMTTQNEPPSTSCFIGGTEGNNGWYIGAVTLTFHAMDPNGVKATYYRINGGEWKKYDGGIVTLDTEGVFTIEYYSIDNLGAIEDVKSCIVKIAKSTPYTICNLHGTLGENDWYISNVEVSFSRGGSPAGIAYTRYRIDGGDWMTYLTPFTVSEEGQHTIEFYSADNAGNVEEIKSVSFKIDKMPPTVQVIYPNGGEELSGVITIEWEADDTVDSSLEISLYYSNDGMTWNAIAEGIENTGSYEWDVTSLPEGNYWIKVVAKDDAGHVAEDTSDGPFTILPTLPLGIEIIKPGNFLYVMDRAIIRLPMPVIIGGITIEVAVEGNVNKLELQIDNEIKYASNSGYTTYSWYYDEPTIGMHEIKAIAYGYKEKAIASIKAFFINLF